MNIKWRVLAPGVCLILGSILVGAQQPSEHDGHPAAGTDPKEAQSTDSHMSVSCAMMQEYLNQFRAAQQEEHALLGALIKAMNEATGSAKVEAIAEAVTQMADGAKNLDAAREDALRQLMQHMSDHMMAHRSSVVRKSEMMNCPMMRGYSDGAGGHEGHGDTPDGGGAGDTAQSPATEEQAGHPVNEQ